MTLIVTKISFLQKGSNNSLKRKDTVNQLGARTVGTKERLKKEPVALDDNYYVSHALFRYNRKTSSNKHIQTQ